MTDPKKLAFDEGKRILGQSAGGLITELAKHFKVTRDESNWWLVMRQLHRASRAADPRAYIGAVLRPDSKTTSSYTGGGYRRATQAELEAYWDKFPQSRGCERVPNWFKG